MNYTQLLKIIILTGLFYSIWKVFFNYSLSPKFGRFWLIMSMFLPVFLVEIKLPVPSLLQFTFPAVSISSVDQTISQAPYFSLHYFYIVITALIFLSLFISFVRIWLLKRKTDFAFKIDGVSIYEGENIKRPFSFARMVFLPSDLDNTVRDIVIRHEISHIRQKHYLDIWFMEIISVFFWFNPFVWIIKNEMKLLHELLADIETVKFVSVKDYLNALAVFSNFSVAPVVSMFSHTKIQKRITMLIQTPKPKPMRVFIAMVAFFIATTLSFANVVPAGASSTSNDTIRPQFPGGNEALRSFIVDNLTYPDQALKNKWEDVVVIEFTVDKNGKVKNPHVIKGQYKILNDEAVRVVSLLPDFVPAKANGKPVETTVKMPIIFRLKE